MNNTLTIINEKDNVGVCLAGSDTIPAGHKQALRDIAEGEFVFKYGQIIGRATRNIKAGEWVHTHNVRSHLDENVEYGYHFCAKTFPTTRQTFRGFARKGRRAGIRNEIYIIPSVGCVNNVCLRLAKAAQRYVETGSIPETSAYTLDFIAKTLEKITQNILSEYGTMPVIYAGGVMSSRYIRRTLEKYGMFADAQYSADTAAGVALLAREYTGAA